MQLVEESVQFVVVFVVHAVAILLLSLVARINRPILESFPFMHFRETQLEFGIVNARRTHSSRGLRLAPVDATAVELGPWILKHL